MRGWCSDGSASGAITLRQNTKKQNNSNNPICCFQTRRGIAAVSVRIINIPTSISRQIGLARIGAIRNVINQANFTRESSLWSQVTGCSRYSPIGSDRSRSIFIYFRLLNREDAKDAKEEKRRKIIEKKRNLLGSLNCALFSIQNRKLLDAQSSVCAALFGFANFFASPK